MLGKRGLQGTRGGDSRAKQPALAVGGNWRDAATEAEIVITLWVWTLSQTIF